jgi:hypothetical protein
MDYRKEERIAMATICVPTEQRVRLSDIPWETYVLYSDGLGPRHIRVTYDRGEMEIMVLSPEHENRKKLLGRTGHGYTTAISSGIELRRNRLTGFGSPRAIRSRT